MVKSKIGSIEIKKKETDLVRPIIYTQRWENGRNKQPKHFKWGWIKDSEFRRRPPYKERRTKNAVQKTPYKERRGSGMAH